MADDLIFSGKICCVLEEYKSFFDHEWSEGLVRKVDNTPLLEAVLTLGFTWKQAANTHQMPWMTAAVVGTFTNTFVQTFVPWKPKIMDSLCERLFKRLPDDFNAMKKQRIMESMREIGAEIIADTAGRHCGLDPNQWWDDATNQPEFQLSIVGSQRLTFCALLFGYEWFVVSCLQVIMGGDHLRTSDKKFTASLDKLFGTNASDQFWSSTPIAYARELRNSIAHQGGKANAKAITLHSTIGDPSNKVQINDGSIIIEPRDNDRLFQMLKLKVSELVDKMMPLLPSAPRPAASTP